MKVTLTMDDVMTLLAIAAEGTLRPRCSDNIVRLHYLAKSVWAEETVDGVTVMTTRGPVDLEVVRP